MLRSIFVIVVLCLSLHGFGENMIIKNAKVFTVDSDQPFAEAINILDNRIIQVGKNKEILKSVTPSTTVIDAHGKLVLPGFNDAHLHFIGGGRTLLEVNLQGKTSFVQITAALLEAAQSNPKSEWLTGRGWDHTLFNNGEWPDKHMLDSIIPDKPVFLRRVDGHVGWANSKALALAKITRETKDPKAGQILRDARGETIGILSESAMNLIMDIIPARSISHDQTAIEQALQMAKQQGVTSIQDNSGINTIKYYHDLAVRNKLTVRVSEWLDFSEVAQPNKLQKQIEHYSKYEIDNLVHIGLLKGFVDGTLGSRTAYFSEPYADDSTTSGIPQIAEDELYRLVSIADSLGLQIGLHCIGEKANNVTVTAYETVSRKSNSTDIRHRIEHAQVLRLQDIPRFAEWGIIASMQPTHCTTDLRWAEKRIGAERCQGAYAWKSLLESGAIVAFGTDWPVEPLNPMRGLYSAVTRQNIETGHPEGGWFEKEKLTMEEAIYCYTMGSAIAEYKEDQKGSITPGKLADLIILSKDILTIPKEEILSTKVDMTLFNGNIIFTREGTDIQVHTP